MDNNIFIIGNIFRNVQRGNLEEVETVLNGAPHYVTTRDSEYRTLLHVAVMNNHVQIVVFLLTKHPNVNAQDDYGKTPLHYAADKDIDFETANSLRQMQLLIDNGANINSQDNDGDTPLHIACRGGNVELTQKLIHSEANQGIRNRFGLTPLDTAYQILGKSYKKYRTYYTRIIDMLTPQMAAPATPLECQFCIEEMTDGQQVVMCPAGHWFHKYCLESWMKTSPSCPTCRIELPADLNGLLQRNGPVYDGQKSGGRRKKSQKSKRKQSKSKKSKSKKRTRK